MTSAEIFFWSYVWLRIECGNVITAWGSCPWINNIILKSGDKSAYLRGSLNEHYALNNTLAARQLWLLWFRCLFFLQKEVLKPHKIERAAKFTRSVCRKVHLSTCWQTLAWLWTNSISNIGDRQFNIDLFWFKISGLSFGVNYIEQFSRLSKF